MADRFPLILNTNANQIQEIASGDSLDLTGTNIANAGIITAGNVVIGAATTDLIVNGNARVTGILTVGTSSLKLDGPNNLVNVGTALTLGHTQGLQFHTQNLHSAGFEVNQINASGIITATEADINGDIDVEGHTNLDNVSVAGVSTFTGLVDANGGATIDNVRIGVAGDNEIDTSTGNLTLDSAAGTVVVADNLNVQDSLTVANTLNANGNIVGDNATNITGIAGITASTLTGTLQTASQPNITSVGTLSSLNVSGNVSVGGTLTYEDVTNVDSVGIVTARNGLKVTGGTSHFVGVANFNQTIVGTARTAIKITCQDESTDTTTYPLFVAATTGDQFPKTGTNLSFNSANGTLTATTFSGSGASLTSLPAANLTGALPAISGANLTGVLKNIIEDTSPQLGGDLDCNQKGILLQDRNSGNQGAIKWGDNGEMWMFHAGADNTNRIYTSGKEWGIWSGASNDHVAFKVTASDTDPAVELYYNNDKKFHTNNLGATVSGGLRINTDTAITGTPVKYLYGYNGSSSKNGLTIEGDEAGLEIISSAGGDHSSSLLLRNLNDGFAFVNNNDANQLELKYFTAVSDNFHVHGTGNGLTKLEKSAIFKEDGAVELYNNNTKRLETAGHGAKVSGYLTMTAPVGFCAYRRDTGTNDEYPLKNSSDAAVNSTYFGHSSIQTPRGQLTTNTQYDNNGSGGSCYSHDGTKFTAPIAGVYTLTFNLSLYVSSDVGTDNSVGWGFFKNQSKVNWGTYDSGLSVTQSTPYLIGQDSTTTLTNAMEIGAPHLTIITTLAAGDEIQVGWDNMSKILGVRSFIFSGHLLG